MKMEFYKIHFENKNIKKEINLNILGKEFFLNNKNKGKIIYENKKYDFADFFKIKNAQKNEIKVKIILDEYCLIEVSCLTIVILYQKFLLILLN